MLKTSFLGRWLVLIVLMSLLPTAGLVFSQTDPQIEDPPPQVIDVWPLPGVEMAGQEPLTLTFNQPMDTASVEEAFAIEPALPGTLAWDNPRTLNFTPDNEWPPETSYTVTLAETAQASPSGVPLGSSYTVEVQTVGPLLVSAQAPEDGTEGVAADSTIVVTFNRPVQPLVSTEDLAELPSPLSIEPAVEGEGEWVNTSIYVFTPTRLAGGTTYTVTVPAGLTSIDGATLSEPASWSFKTLPPQVLSISPQAPALNFLLDDPIVIRFSQAMDRASVEEAFSLALLDDRSPVEGRFEWSAGDTTVTFQPSQRLTISTTYLLTLEDTARSASGEATIADTISYAVQTVPLPAVARSNPANGERNVSPGRGAWIEFRSPMNPDTFEDKIIIEPEPENWTPQVDGEESTRYLSLNFNALPETRYTITLLAGSEDIYGNPIERDYTFSYETGPIPTVFRPIIRGRFMLTGAHRDNTRFAVNFSGKPEVDFRLYRVPLDGLDPNSIVNQYYDADELPSFASDDTLVRAWTETFDSQGRTNALDDVYLAGEDGGTLPNGVYWVWIRAPQDYGSGVEYRVDQFAIAVVTSTLTVKRTEDETLVWVTDMPTSEPVADATVGIYHHQRLIARGETDADGVFRAPVDVPTNDPFLFIVAQTDDDYGVWHANRQPTTPDEQNYLYTDRPIYRPGETVYFRGAERLRDDMTYLLPNQRTVKVSAQSWATGDTLYEETVELTAFGTYSGQFDLAEEAPLGEVSILINDSQRLSFRVAEFRVPEYEVAVNAQQPEIIQGETLNALVEADYYFGGPVSSANVDWYLEGRAGFFNYTGPGRYTFLDETAGFPSLYLSDQAQTDAEGNYLIRTPDTDSGVNRPMQIFIQGTVRDESNQPISSNTTVLAHPANIYVGQRTNQYFGKAGEPMTVDLITVTPDSAPVAEKPVELTLIETRWQRVPVEGQFGRYNWEREEIEVLTDRVVTGEDGTAQFTFTPPNGGIFRLRASTFDERERVNSSTLRFWVIGDRPVWWGQPSTQLDLVANADSYVPGDTAEILVPLPFAGKSTLLVTTERAGIMSHEVVSVEGSTLLYELPITDAHAPTVHLTVVAMKGVDEESLNPEYRMGRIALQVEPVARQLNVEITPSKSRAQPRDEVSFDVYTTDAQGEPVSAEVGLRLTDKAILALAPPNARPILEQFYGPQSNYVHTGVALDGLLDTLTDQNVAEEQEEADLDDATPEIQSTATARGLDSADEAAAAPAADGAGGGPDQQQPVVREDFQQTPLWEPHVVTDDTGRATVSLTLPDNLTTWHLDARALTEDTRVGQQETELIVTLPLLVRPATPRFFVVGDQVELAMVVNNNTESDQTLQATLEHEGVTLDGDATQTVTVPALGRLRVTWMATVEDVEAVKLTFSAVGDGVGDASQPPLADEEGRLPVYRYTAPDTTGTAGLIREEGSRVEGIALPSRLSVDSGTVQVRIDPSLAVTAIDSFSYLRNYKHQCIEQTVSRFLPNAVTFKALQDLDIDDPVLEANLFETLTEGLRILKDSQNPDGGWGWFSGMESNPLVTAYAALGLIEAREAGFTIDDAMLADALAFVRRDYITPDRQTTEWRLNRQAFYFYVAARNKQGNLEEFEDLLEWRLKMSYMSRAYLLMAYHELFPEAGAIQDLTSDLTSAAILSATGAHWEEDFNDWWNWSSDTRTTAVVLSALTRVQQDSDLLANAVRWLMIARRGDHWTTTQETVWAVIGLTDWMVLTGELQGDYDYAVSLNREVKAEGDVDPATVREGQVIDIPVSELSADDLNRLVVSRGAGDGVLYYTTHLDIRLPADQVEAIDRGIKVQREYFIEGKPETPVTEAQIGDTITVRLTMTLPQDVYYFVLEDPIPSGTEGVDTSLLTTGRDVPGPNLYRQENPRWYWGWWWFDRTELRDEQTNLYADFLARGTYVYSYQVQATTPGIFQTLPSHAFAFYQPEVFGRTDGTLFTITEEQPDATSDAPDTE